MSVKADLSAWYDSVKDSSNFERWMSQLPEALRSVPITQLAIPGTHDSMTCGITKRSDVSPDTAEFIKRLAHYFRPIVKPIIFNWCVTQHRSAVDQLMAGIRYFDLRVASNKRTGGLHFVHGMYAQEVAPSLSDMKEFLKLHEDEVLVLDLQHFYDFSPEHHTELQDLLNNMFEKKMCPLPESQDLSKLTLNWLSKHRYQVIVIYRDEAGQSDRRLWSSDFWPTPWPQTTSIDNMIDFLTRGLSGRPSNAGYVTQCVLTPDTWFVVRHILSSLERKCSVPCNYAVIPWLKEQHPGPKGVNVVITDFFDFDHINFPFVKTVILLNSKLVMVDCKDHNTDEVISVE